MSTTSCKVAAADTGRTCKHYRDGQCTSALALPLYGAHPSVGVCQVCEHYRGRPRGLGDVVEAAARLLGIKRAVKVVEHATGKQCGCPERRQALNEKYPTSANAGIDETPKERLKGQPVWVKLDQYARLRALADKDGKPLAAHARRAIELYLRREERKGATIEVRG